MKIGRNSPRNADQPQGFAFIDLLCGVGGFRLGLQAAGGSCVFSSDWDTHARQTYVANFGVIVGRPIPAGTGMATYREIYMEKEEPAPPPTLEELLRPEDEEALSLADFEDEQ